MKRLLVNLFAAIGLLVVVITATPFVGWYARVLSGPFSDPPGKTLIVLGATRSGEGLIGNDTYWRAVYALRAYRKERFQRIILSGSGTSDSMSLFLRFQGVPGEIILQEAQSSSTRENALFAKNMLADSLSPVVLLTSDYHMFRARRAFARCGVAVLPRPIPDAIKHAVQWTERWSVFVIEVVETTKIGYYFVRGWL